MIWDADFRFHDGAWENWAFVGDRWKRIHMLARARQGMVIVVQKVIRATRLEKPNIMIGHMSIGIRSALTKYSSFTRRQATDWEAVRTRGFANGRWMTF